jgi:hypothetical protein
LPLYAGPLPSNPAVPATGIYPEVRPLSVKELTEAVPPLTLVAVVAVATFPPVVASVPVVGSVKDVEPVVVKVIGAGVPARVKVDVSLLETPVPPFDGISVEDKPAAVPLVLDDVVATVPDVGKVNDVEPVVVRVTGEGVPANVRVLDALLATPVPPLAGDSVAERPPAVPAMFDPVVNATVPEASGSVIVLTPLVDVPVILN